MKKLSLLLALVLLLAFNQPVSAQDEEEEYVIKDVLEVVGFFGAAVPAGGVSDFQPDDGPPLGANVGFCTGGDIGYFLTPELVIGINFTYSQHTIDDDAVEGDLGSLKHRFYNPSLYMRYYFFGESNFAPFVKFHAGVDNPKFTTLVTDGSGLGVREKFRELSYDPSLGLGAGAGMLYYTSDYGGLFLDASIHYGFTEDTKGDYQGESYTFGENTLMINIQFGIAVYFGP
jgi:outer membrane protein W